MENMKYRFEKISQNSVLLSILMVVFGLVLCIWPGQILNLAGKVIGIGLLVGAAVSAISWYRNRHKVGNGYGGLAVAVLLLVAGVVVLAAPIDIITLVPKVIGIAVLINGVINLAQALELRNVGQSSWISSLVMAVLTMALGAFLVFYAFTAVQLAVVVVGGVFIYNGVSNLWIESRYKKMGR